MWWASTTLALAIAFGACKEEPAAWPPKKDHAEGQSKTSAPPAAEGGFTPAEIRRAKPVEIDTAAKPVDAAAPSESAPASPEATIPPKTVVAKSAAPPAPLAEKPAAPKAGESKPATKSVEPAQAAVATGTVGQPGESGEWVLQVNVHRSETEAKAQIAKLGQQGIPAYAIPVPTGDATLSGNYWRVRVGRFQSRAEAQGYGKSVLEPKGLKFWVDKKSNEAKQGT